MSAPAQGTGRDPAADAAQADAAQADAAQADAAQADAAFGAALRRLLPLLFGCYIAAYLDRVNVGFAKLQMAQGLAWSDAVFGFGAGIFFLGYFLFEVPSNLLLERVGARRWIARIMISWGVVSGAFAVVDRLPWGPFPGWFGVEPAVFGFYLLRFLLGVAEAGFFPGMILYLTFWFPGARRARVVALCATAIAVANVAGAPLSGAIMQGLDGAAGWAGWRWLFVLEAVPSVLMGLVILRLLPDGPAQAAWLAPAHRATIERALAADRAAAGASGDAHRARDALLSGRVWALALVYLCSTLSLYGINFWMPTLIQELGIAPTDYLTVGLLSMIPWGTAGVVMVWAGSHSDRTGERRWHVAGALLAVTAGLLLLIAAGRAVVPSLLALSVVASGVLAFVATFWSIPTAFLRASAAAAGIAWINSVGNLGGHFGPDLIGRIRTASGSATGAFLFLAAMALLGATLTLWVTRSSATATTPMSPTR